MKIYDIVTRREYDYSGTDFNWDFPAEQFVCGTQGKSWESTEDKTEAVNAFKTIDYLTFAGWKLATYIVSLIMYDMDEDKATCLDVKMVETD